MANYPLKEEMRLKQVINFFTLNKVEKNKKKVDSLQGSLFQITDDDRKDFIKELANIAISIHNQIFDSWSMMTDEELKRTDLTGAKKWIKENYDLFNNTEDVTFESLEKIRDRNAEALRIETNKMFDLKIKGNLTKTKRQRILDSIDAEARPSKRMLEIKSKLENWDTVTSDEMNELQTWIEKRNKNWANNQTGNFYSESCKDLASENNIEYYIWRTKEDDRVRPSHALKNNKKFRFDEGIKPGEEWNCRCEAIPVLDKKEK